jgi:hypothetical protein
LLVPRHGLWREGAAMLCCCCCRRRLATGGAREPVLGGKGVSVG